YEIQAPEDREVELYWEVAPHWGLHLPTQESTSETFTENGITYLKTGSVAQKILERTGDHVRNDWGYFYLASDHPSARGATGKSLALRQDFLGQPAAARPEENPGPDQLALRLKTKG